MNNPKPDTQGLLALVLGAVCIGFAPVWVRWSEVGPIATAFHRVLLALPFLGLWAATERGGPAFSRSDRSWAIAAGICFAIDLAAWHGAIHFTSVANATLLANFAPIFVTFGAWLCFGERVPGRFFVGMAFALSGAWLLTGATLQADPSRLRGDALALVTAVFYGAYQLGVARLRRHHSAGRTLFQTSLVSVPILGLMALTLEDRVFPGTFRGWFVVIGLALTAQALGQGLITYGFAHLPAGYSSLTLLVQPMVAVFAGWLVLGETLGLRQFAGSLVLLAGLFVARRRSSGSTTVPDSKSRF